jgi:hypothetical protein
LFERGRERKRRHTKLWKDKESVPEMRHGEKREREREERERETYTK